MKRELPLIEVAALCAGVVGGYVLGQGVPRAELHQAQERVAELEEELEGASSTSVLRSPVPGLDRILQAPPERGRELPVEQAEPPREQPEATALADGGLPLQRSGDGGVATPRWRERWQERTAQPVNERLDGFLRAASIQRVRRMQSRAALIEQADLSDEERQEVDEALAEMNEALYGHAEELLVLGLASEAPQPRDLLGVTHDITGILHRAQLRLETIVGTERALDVDASALEIWNHVDLSALEPAARAVAEGAP